MGVFSGTGYDKQAGEEQWSKDQFVDPWLRWTSGQLARLLLKWSKFESDCFTQIRSMLFRLEFL